MKLFPKTLYHLSASWIALIPFPRWTYKSADTLSSILPVVWKPMRRIAGWFSEVPPSFTHPLS